MPRAEAPTLRVAVTGARGRLGRTLVPVLQSLGHEVIAWSRPHYDLDDPASGAALMVRDRPDLVVHAAAWVDVDGCARDPDLAMRRNADAASHLARAAARSTVDFVLISTNEVFDGQRTDGVGYRESDPTAPANPYGASKLQGEMVTAAALAGGPSRLWIVRTSWLFSTAGGDFPSKIVAASDRATTPLRVVDDEFGCPTAADGLARAIGRLVAVAPPGIYHLAGREHLSRYQWADDVLRATRPDAVIDPVPSSEFKRASTPPAWGVLDSSLAAGLGVQAPPWSEARDEVLRWQWRGSPSGGASVDA